MRHRAYEPNGEPYQWITSEDLLLNFNKSISLKRSEGCCIPIGEYEIKRSDCHNCSTLQSWNVWKRFHEYGDDCVILKDLAKVDGYTKIKAFGQKQGDIIDKLLFLTNSKYAQAYYPHLDAHKLYSRFGNMTFIQTLERKRMQLSLSYSSSVQKSNTMLNQYFTYMDPSMVRYFRENKLYETFRAAIRSFHLKIVSIDHEKMKLVLFYSDELDKNLISPTRDEWVKRLESIVLFDIFKPFSPVFEPSFLSNIVPQQFQNVFDYNTKWYDKDNVISTDLPLFQYQKMMVKQMIDQENRESTVSHCLEHTINKLQDNSVHYNVLGGFQHGSVSSTTGGFLCMDVGLGKTLCIIALVMNNIDIKTLVIVPLTLMDQWKAEVEKFDTHNAINVTEFYGKTRDLSGDIVLSTYSTIRSLHKRCVTQEMDTHDLFIIFDRVVFDESHQLSNCRTKAVTACDGIVAPFRWCVTATPILKNSFRSLEGQLKLLGMAPFTYKYNPLDLENRSAYDRNISIIHRIINKTFFVHTRRGLSRYKLEYDSVKQIHNDVIVNDSLTEYNMLHKRIKERIQGEHLNYGKLVQFKNLLQICCMHPCLIPLTHYGTHLVNVHDPIAASAKQVKSGMGDTSYDKEIKETLNKLDEVDCVICMEILTRPTITQCKHIFCHDCIVTQLEHRPRCPMCRERISMDTLTEIKEVDLSIEENGDNVYFSDVLGKRYSISKTFYNNWHKRKENMFDSPKLKAVDDIVKGTNESIILFSQFNCVLQLLKEKYPEASIITGSTSRKKRAMAIEQFQNKTCKLFLLSTKCASVGITLTSGSHIIFIEPILDESIKIQAIGRLARTGQLNDVQVHNIITEESMDQQIIKFSKNYDNMLKEMKKDNSGQQLSRVEKNYTKTELLKMLL